MRTFIAAALIGSFSCLTAQEGTVPRWEIIEVAESLSENARHIQTILGKVRPKEWIQDGAPQGYVDQYATLQADIKNLALSAQGLAREPEKLSTTINTFLWLDRVGSMVSSLAAGVREYQNAAVADLLTTARDRTTAAEDKLKEYMKQRAVDQEAELEIADREAQRCRGDLLKQPPSRD